MDVSSPPPGRRTLTPAVLGSAAFTVACAVIAITFVAARGGLQLPVAASGSPVAVASTVPSAEPSVPAPTPVTPTPSPTVPPGPTLAPTAEPTATPVATPAGSPDPLSALAGCPGLPGCYEYVIQRGDSLSGIASRYVIPVRIVLALNPQITDPSTIVVGQTLYLGRDPFLRLPPCETEPACSLYTVRPGDLLSSIAFRFGIEVDAILIANPQITNPNAIFSGQVLRLPWPAQPSPA